MYFFLCENRLYISTAHPFFFPSSHIARRMPYCQSQQNCFKSHLVIELSALQCRRLHHKERKRDLICTSLLKLERKCAANFSELSLIADRLAELVSAVSARFE